MRVQWLGGLAAILFLVLSCISAANLKAEIRTKQLLYNIRSHLAKQVDEVVQQKECDSGLTLCEPPKEKEASVEDEEESEEIQPPPKIRGHHKPLIRVNPKDVIQNMIHNKVHINRDREPEKEKRLKAPEPKKLVSNEDSDENDDDNDDEDKPKQKKSATVAKKGEQKKETKKKKKVEEDDEEEGARFPKDLAVFALTSSSVKSDLCRRHSRLFLRQLARYRLWALMMYDASAKLPSGVLQGNVNQFGDFDECLAVNAVLKDKKEVADLSGGIQGQYCLAAIDIEATADEGALQQAIDKAQAYGFIRSSNKDPGYFVPRFTTINWGVCVPASCSADDVEQGLNDELSDYNVSAGVEFSASVEEEACMTRDDLGISFSFGLLFTILLYGGVVALAGFATYKDLKPQFFSKPQPEEESEEVAEKAEEPEEKPAESDSELETTKQGKLNRLLMAFSLKKSVEELTKPAGDDEIQCIHGIKAVFTVLLYIAHKTGPLALTPFTNRVAFTKLTNYSASSLLRASIIYTDGFLLASGVLSGWQGAKSSAGWLRRLCTRFFRLTPPLLAVVLGYAYVSEQLDSGPLWGPVVAKNAQLCRDNGWSNMFYIQNFFDFEEMCAPQTHQLALDMQLSCAAPLLVGSLHKYDLLGVLILQAIFIFSSVLRYIVTANNDLSLLFFHGMEVSQLYRTANLLYSQAIYRATPYVLGITVGYFLRQRGEELRDVLKKSLVAIGWIFAGCLTLLTIVTPAHLADRHYTYSVEEAAQYAALAPIAWSLALGWCIAACHLDYGGRLNSILSSRPLLVLSRLSYAIYLVQFLVFNHNVATIRTPQAFSITEAITVQEIVTVLSLALAVTLLFDFPMKEAKTVLMEIEWFSKTEKGDEPEEQKEEEPAEEETEEKDQTVNSPLEEEEEVKEEEIKMEDEQLIDDEEEFEEDDRHYPSGTPDYMGGDEEDEIVDDDGMDDFWGQEDN